MIEKINCSKIKFNLDKINSIDFDFMEHHNPLYKTLELGSAKYNLKIIDRFSPIESIASEWVLAKIYSEMSQYIVPKRAEHLRTLAAELQVILWNLEFIKNNLKASSEKVYIEHIYFLREIIFDIQELWMGARVLPQYLNISGVERDLTIGIKAKITKMMKHFKLEYMQFFLKINEDKTFLHRLKNVMIVSPVWVKILNLGGLLAFSCGINNEVKTYKKYGAYGFLDTYMPKSQFCTRDAWSRFVISLDWLKFTLENVDKLLDSVPEGNYNIKEENLFEPSNGYFKSCLDAPSGPLFATYALKKISLSSSSIRLRPFISKILENQKAEDLELAFASISLDPAQGALA